MRLLFLGDAAEVAEFPLLLCRLCLSTGLALVWLEFFETCNADVEQFVVGGLKCLRGRVRALLLSLAHVLLVLGEEQVREVDNFALLLFGRCSQIVTLGLDGVTDGRDGRLDHHRLNIYRLYVVRQIELLRKNLPSTPSSFNFGAVATTASLSHLAYRPTGLTFKVVVPLRLLRVGLADGF